MNKYEEIWQLGKTAILLPGLYTVKVVSGPVRLMNIIGDEKVITGDEGYNILYKQKIWGDFKKLYTDEGVVLKYKRFRDILHQLPDGMWMGKIMIGQVCLGYFYLINRFYLWGSNERNRTVIR